MQEVTKCYASSRLWIFELCCWRVTGLGTVIPETVIAFKRGTVDVK